jgi:hypothetical protein
VAKKKFLADLADSADFLFKLSAQSPKSAREKYCYSNSKTTADFGSNVISELKSNVFPVITSFPDL